MFSVGVIDCDPASQKVGYRAFILCTMRLVYKFEIDRDLNYKPIFKKTFKNNLNFL